MFSKQFDLFKNLIDDGARYKVVKVAITKLLNFLKITYNKPRIK